MSELKPCPFCGGEAELDEYCGKYVVFCKNASCSWRKTKAEAIEAWNTRYEQTCRMEQSFAEPSRLDFMQEYLCLSCKEYGYMQIAVDGDRLNYCPNCGARVKEG